MIPRLLLPILFIPALTRGEPDPGASGESGNWTWFRLPDLPAAMSEVSGFRSPSFAVLPDGRFLYGHGRFTSAPATRFWTQDAWGAAGMTQTAGLEDVDPSFLAIRDANTALIGTGGNFGVSSDIWVFDPSDTAGQAWSGISQLQQFAAAHWRNPATGTEGWLVAGGNGTGGSNAVSYVSLDGSVSKVVIDNVSAFSSGLAVGPGGDVFVAGFDFDSPPEKAHRFSAALVEGAITGSVLTPASGEFLFGFDSAGGLAVDARGRIWAGGFAADGYLQLHDPSTGGVVRVTPEHPDLAMAGSLLYTPVTFSRDGTDYIGWFVRDAYDVSSDLYFGYGAIGHHEAPPMTGWLHAFFGAEAYDASKETTLWGDGADGDDDDLSTLLEYGLKTDPTAFTRLSDAYTVKVDASGFEVAFTRDPSHTDIDIVVEVSATPGDAGWDEIARSVGGGVTASSGIGAGRVSETTEGDCFRVEVADPVTVGSAPARFARVRVIRNE